MGNVAAIVAAFGGGLPPGLTGSNTACTIIVSNLDRERTVMEAVTAILAGGQHVSVLLQGKKVRDDKQTLIQVGISSNDKIGNLGFTLEHNPTQTSLPLTCPEDPNSVFASNHVLPCASMEPAHRNQGAQSSLSVGSEGLSLLTRLKHSSMLSKSSELGGGGMSSSELSKMQSVGLM